MSVLACPQPELLASFCDGLIDEEDSARIGTHIDECTRCQDSLATLLEQPHDELLDKLRYNTGPADPYGAEPMCRKIVDRVAHLTANGDISANAVSSSAAMPDIPDLIGHYKVLRLLGQGGMGTVYQALHIDLDKVVAIKLLTERWSRNEAAVSRFRREMKAVGKLQHPNIVTAFDAGQANGTHYLVMEFVAGIDLSEVMKRHTLLGIPEACELIQQAANGLEHAARRGLVHRDIKPSNLMLTLDDAGKPLVKVLDLGLALLADPGSAASPMEQSTDLTGVGQVMGTVDYMAPEQALNSHDVDVRADVYSLGATLCKLLTGAIPFSRVSGASIARKLAVLAYESAPSISIGRPDLPPNLASLIDSMLARERDQRPATPGEVARRLSPFAVGSRLNVLLAAAPASEVDTVEFSVATITQPKPVGRSSHTIVPVLPSVESGAVQEQFATIPPSTDDRLPVSSRSRIIQQILAAVVACGLLIAAWGFWQTFFIQTSDGFVVLEIKDPGVKVTLGEKSFTLDNNGTKYEISPGAHVLRINHSGLTYETDKFMLLKGRTEIFNVQLLSGKILVMQGNKELIAKPLTSVANNLSPAVPLTAKSDRQPNSGIAAAPLTSLNPRNIRTSPDDEWTAPEKLGPEVNSEGHESFPRVSADGKRMWFQRDSWLWISERESPGKPWQTAKRVTNAFQPPGAMSDMFVSRDELTWMFATWTDPELVRIMESTRPSREAPWPTPRDLGEISIHSHFPVMTDDGLTLYFDRNFRTNEGDEICVATRPDREAAWSHPVRLPAPVNTAADERPLWISKDQKSLMFFAQLEPRTSSRQWDLFLTTRRSLTEPWQEPISFGPGINTEAFEASAWLSDDGRELIFAREVPGQINSDLFVSRRVLNKKGGTAHIWPADAPPPAVAPFDKAQAQTHQEAWAKYLGVPVEYTNSIGMKFVLIPPGEFTMGSTTAEIEAALKDVDQNQWQEYIQSEAPQHKVVLTQPLYLGMNEVTQAEYVKVMGTNPSHFAPLGKGKDVVAGMATTNHPVEMVCWNDAAEFCAKLSQQEKLEPFYFRDGETILQLSGTGYRLPSEAEWEFACRAGTATKYWIGDQHEDLVMASSFGGNSGGRTHAVRELKANPFGLYDIHGNVWELMQDGWNATYYGEFQENVTVSPICPFSAGSQHVIRGGSWSVTAPFCRSSNRLANVPTFRFEDTGFRVSLPLGAAIAERAAQPDHATSNWDGWPPDAPAPAVAPFNAETAKDHQLAWAKHFKVPVEYTNSIGMKFVLIPPGEFTMGSSPEEINAAPMFQVEDDDWSKCVQREGPQHQVILTQPFYLAIHEVTQAAYAKIMAQNPSIFSPQGDFKDRVAGLDTSNFPVETVNWNDVSEFCVKLSSKEGLQPVTFNQRTGEVPIIDGNGYRLPTEAEWEFACRAGTTTQFWSGNSFEVLNTVGWHGGNSQHRTHEVGGLKANPFGLHDVHGNVWEWVLDVWDHTSSVQYTEVRAINPLGSATDTNRRIVRGGFWATPEARCCSARRFAQTPHEKYGHNGFRVVLSIDAVK